jgi:protocatechuate 3,4-dioxygenase beta subunit
MHTHDHDDFGGLHQDLTLVSAAMHRRDVLRMAFGASVIHLLGCSSNGTSPTNTNTGTDCTSVIPEETAGPFPGDGSNGPDVLTQTGVVRSDIRSSFAGLTGTAEGIPLTVTLTIVSASSCEAFAGHAVYVWHCDRSGRYSLYSSGVTDQNYLRGVQETDGDGKVTFTTVFPACYSGRWPHIHFEVYPSLDAATSVSNKVATSQLALPKATCDLVYATAGYEQSITNLQQTSLATDMVFSDGASLEIPTITGDISGFAASLHIAV